jgi:hypothetical protein
MEGGALRDWMNWAGHNDTGGVFAEAGGEGGPIGILIGLILDVVISMLLVFLVAFLLWLGLGALFTAIFVLAVPLFFMVQRSLRSAVAHGRSCRGRVIKSLRHALFSTAVNMGWLYASYSLGMRSADSSRLPDETAVVTTVSCTTGGESTFKSGGTKALSEGLVFIIV